MKQKQLQSKPASMPTKKSTLATEFAVFLEPSKQQLELDSMLKKTQESFVICGAIMDKIMKRFEIKAYLREIDSKRIPYCIETALEEIVSACQMTYEIFHDPGEDPSVIQDLPQETEEPKVPGKDTINSLSAKIGNEKPLQLSNLYDLKGSVTTQGTKHEKKLQLQELENQKRKFIYGKNELAEGGITVKDCRSIEADDELAIRIRQQKWEARQKVLQLEREAKEKALREKQKLHEIELINKELEGAAFTYDYKGNIVVQNKLNTDFLPPDFKFKYKVKKQLQPGEEDGKKSRKNLLSLQKKANGDQVNYNNLSKLSDPKQINGMKQMGGSMFDFFKPIDAGFLIKQDKKLKYSKKKFDEVYGKMSVDTYTKKVTTEGNFQSLMINPDLLLNEGTLPRTQLKTQNSALQISEKNEFLMKIEEHKLREDYINKLRSNRNLSRDMPDFSDKHNVLMQSPQSLNQLIVFPQMDRLDHTQQSAIVNQEEQKEPEALVSETVQALKQCTEGYYKFGKRKLSESKEIKQQMKTQLIEKFDDFNSQLVMQPNWGQQTQLPDLKQSLTSFKSQSSLHPLQNRATTSQQSLRSGIISRPFSRATQISSSQQSLRQVTTAATQQRTQKRNIQIYTEKAAQNKKKHLAPPPLGKTMGHGLLYGKLLNQHSYNSTMNLKHQTLYNNSSMGNLQQQAKVPPQIFFSHTNTQTL